MRIYIYFLLKPDRIFGHLIGEYKLTGASHSQFLWRLIEQPELYGGGGGGG
uniref:Uncharacterized protein n=1 Tax=Chionoecetes opilio bacilliform virus TaxID=1825681 RepID=A0A1Q3DLW2_9VIRU|nr:hypothetical protein SCV_054 [Chionoecetes opilio bacilliform virus]